MIYILIFPLPVTFFSYCNQDDAGGQYKSAYAKQYWHCKSCPIISNTIDVGQIFFGCVVVVSEKNI